MNKILYSQGAIVEQVSFADEYIRAFFNARDEFARYWCAIRRYDINNLSDGEKYEIQNHPDYTKPCIEILPYGHLTLGDEAILKHYSAGVDGAIELGTLCGRGAAILSKQANFVVTIDNYAEDVYQGMYHTIDTVRKRLLNYHNVLAIKRETYESGLFVRETITNKFDLLFIDADHSFEGVERDFEHWFPLMESGAYILFHDCNKFHPGVLDFVNQIPALYMQADLTCPIELVEQGKEGESSIAVFRKK